MLFAAAACSIVVILIFFSWSEELWRNDSKLHVYLLFSFSRRSFVNLWTLKMYFDEKWCWKNWLWSKAVGLHYTKKCEAWEPNILCSQQQHSPYIPHFAYMHAYLDEVLAKEQSWREKNRKFILLLKLAGGAKIITVEDASSVNKLLLHHLIFFSLLV